MTLSVLPFHQTVFIFEGGVSNILNFTQSVLSKVRLLIYMTINSGVI